MRKKSIKTIPPELRPFVDALAELLVMEYTKKYEAAQKGAYHVKTKKN